MCRNIICLPFILLYRYTVHVCLCFFQHNPEELQLCELRNNNGGWWRDQRRQSVSVRDSFYIFMTHKLENKLVPKHLVKFLRRLSKLMTNNGQIPWKIQSSWFGEEVPIYVSHRKAVRVIDANMQFIIMTWWLYETDPGIVHSLYLHCLRAWQWLDVSIANEAIHEPIDASWETSRKHKGRLLLTNVLAIQTIRSMELLSMTEHDKRRQTQFIKMHEKWLSVWIPEIYKTQETLPRILAVYFGIVQRSFVKSFNQAIQSVWIPCRVDGPIQSEITSHAWIHGYADQHNTVIWPWIGFLWILVLKKRGLHDIADSWWTSYMEFHNIPHLYDMYSQETGKPVIRAFLKAQPNHALTMVLHAYVSKKYRVCSEYSV